jgi:hypothetical protein
LLHVYRPSLIVNQVQKQPKHKQWEMISAAVNEIDPSVRNRFSIRATHDHIGHRLQAAAQEVGAVALLGGVRPVDGELLVRGAGSVVFQVQEKLTFDLPPEAVAHLGNYVRNVHKV